MGADSIALVRDAAAASLVDAALAKNVTTSLMQAVLDDNGNTPDLAAELVTVMFDLANSGSGAEVRERSGGTDGLVLILGYAGSSCDLLRAIDASYQRLLPSWTTLTTVSSGMIDHPAASVIVQDQIDALAARVEKFDRVILHSFSNNGIGFFARLMSEWREKLGSKLVGCVHDCGGVSEDSYCVKGDPLSVIQARQAQSAEGSLAADWPVVVAETLIMSFMSHDVQLLAADGSKLNSRVAMAALKPLIHKAVEAYTVHTNPATVFWLFRVRIRLLEEDGPNAPPLTINEAYWRLLQSTVPETVPIQIFTTETDAVVSYAVVKSFENGLRKHMPSRPVELTTLRGSHCQLITISRTAYEAQLEVFLSAAAKVTPGGAIGSGAAVSGLGPTPPPPEPPAAIEKPAEKPDFAVPDPAMPGFLAAAALSHLEEKLRSVSLQAWKHALDESNEGRPNSGKTDFRPELLRILKEEAGVAKLADRQTLAKAVCRAHREGTLAAGTLSTLKAGK